MKIFLIDDDEDIHLLLGVIVRSSGNDLIGSYSGEEAQKKLENFIPDVILIDYMLPDIDGKSLMKKLMENYNLRNVPFIFLTGKNDKELSDQLIKAGSAGVITKPFDPNNLWSEIESLLREQGS